jgi:hypothetical protein
MSYKQEYLSLQNKIKQVNKKINVYQERKEKIVKDLEEIEWKVVKECQDSLLEKEFPEDLSLIFEEIRLLLNKLKDGSMTVNEHNSINSMLFQKGAEWRKLCKHNYLAHHKSYQDYDSYDRPPPTVPGTLRCLICGFETDEKSNRYNDLLQPDKLYFHDECKSILRNTKQVQAAYKKYGWEQRLVLNPSYIFRWIWENNVESI